AHQCGERGLVAALGEAAEQLVIGQLRRASLGEEGGQVSYAGGSRLRRHARLHKKGTVHHQVKARTPSSGASLSASEQSAALARRAKVSRSTWPSAGVSPWPPETGHPRPSPRSRLPKK